METRRAFLQHAVALLGTPPRLFDHLKAVSPAGTTYYIDTSGANHRPGTSPRDAWADFTKLNSMRLNPGDSILLKRGCVWKQQSLVLNGRGSPDRFVVVGAYGVGDRPKIQQSGRSSDFCIKLVNASYLRVSSLEVCDGGVGILLFYDCSYNNRSVYLDDIIAHNFQAASPSVPLVGRVSWAYGIGITGVDQPGLGQERVLTDFKVTNTEVYNTGAGIALDWTNHHTLNGENVRRNKFGDVYMENLKLHDNTVQGISFVSLFLTSVTNCTIKNSVIDKGARFAPTGSSALQVMYTKGVTLQNVRISNTLLDDCPDNSALDFECDNEDALVDGCTFENNAGPAIEILATPDNPSPYTRNFVIQNCTFIGNNWAKKLGNSQIVVPDWTKGNTPNGRIQNNKYRNAPGTDFFGGSGNVSQIKLANNHFLG